MNNKQPLQHINFVSIYYKIATIRRGFQTPKSFVLGQLFRGFLTKIGHVIGPVKIVCFVINLSTVFQLFSGQPSISLHCNYKDCPHSCTRDELFYPQVSSFQNYIQQAVILFFKHQQISAWRHVEYQTIVIFFLYFSILLASIPYNDPFHKNSLISCS